MLHTGLNPYGLTYLLGLQGKGTSRANPAGSGLEGFLALAQELHAQTLEIYDPWLAVLSDRELAALSDRLRSFDMTPVISAGLNMMGPIDSALRSAKCLGATTIRLGLSPVLEGNRHGWGAKWPELIAIIRENLAKYAPLASDQGASFAIENHQDFTSQELVDFCNDAGPAVGICFDTGNTFPVCEAPLDFVSRVAPFVRHVHLKDYRVQFTSEGYRLIRCAIGDGAVPFQGIVEILGRHHQSLGAVLELGALEARHIRFLNPEWWHGYAPASAAALAAALAAAQLNRLPDDTDYRTPWERGADGELVEYELQMIRRSAANMQKLGLMK
jgi:sugar phosphate isomerase/epimerase